MSVADWKKRVAQLRSTPHRQHSQVIFIGDSITEGWTDVAKPIWTKTLAPYKPLCLGIGGDQTQNVLWRIDQGELQGLCPKVAVILIGVNNIWWGGFTLEETARGIVSVVTRARKDLPNTQFIIHGIFPAGRRADDEIRQRIVAANRLVKTALDGLQDLRFFDIGQIFLEHDGSIDQAIMHDFLHLTEKGYGRWATALSQPLKEHAS